MWRRCAISLAALWLGAAGPKPADLAGQFVALAFDANAGSDTPARAVLGRWAGPVRWFVFGRPSDRVDAGQAVRSLSRAAHLPMQVVRENQVLGLPPNAFVVVDANVAGALAGPLRAMLQNVFLGDAGAMQDFLGGVAAVQPCWMLPVWTDAGRTELKAAVIGVDAGQKRPAIQHCLLREVAAAIGLMGDGGALAGSVFNPKLEARRLSREDAAMLRLLYGPALHPGMSRAEVTAAAALALRRLPPATSKTRRDARPR